MEIVKEFPASQILNSIAEINDDKETLKVVVRLINMWTIPRSRKFTIELILVDKKVSGSINNCTLWEALAMELKDYLDRHVTRSVVLLLSMAKMKEARVYGSQIFVNNNMKEIVEFKDRLATSMDPSQITMIPCIQRGSQTFGSSLYFFGDRFLHNAHVKCFDKVSQVKKECMCVIVATITNLLVANGWIYEACLKCNKKVYEEALSFICVGCGNESASTIPKFRVEVRVAQSLEYAIFTLWDRECYALINETATDIKQIIIYEEGVFDPIDIPEALNRVLGKRLAFRFKVVPGNTHEALISFVLAKFPSLDLRVTFNNNASQPLLSLIHIY
ncbi:hypothetical protein GmHk_06G016542 [Glycine max]|nr:hypothetical protein GmHk_06G016542 [Glycine max]